MAQEIDSKRLPQTIDLALSYVLSTAQYQAVNRDDGGKGYFDGFCAGMATASGIILGGLGYAATIINVEVSHERESNKSGGE